MPRSYAIAAAGILALAAALRFATLGAQSFWLDEAVTAQVVTRDLGGVFSSVWHGESTPPLYYVLAWLWVKPFGNGEVGLRALSAFLGTLTVAVAFGLGGRMCGRRAALLAGLLAACSPLLVWYSQEARAYALLVLLGSLSVLLALRAVDVPTHGRLLLWGAAAALGLASHYFAVFLVVPEAVWLAARLGWRRAGWALAPPMAMAAVLAPLALHQDGDDRAAFIRASSLRLRTGQIGKQWLIGYDAPSERLLAVVAGLLVLSGLVLLVIELRRSAPQRVGGPRVVALMSGLVALAVLAPLVLAVLGADDVLTRNLLGALVPGLCVVGAGYAVGRGAGLLAAGALCGVWLVAVIGVAGDPAMQRDDWRDAAHAIGPAAAPRAVVVTPGSGRIPAEHYLPGAKVAAPMAPPVAEIDLLGIARRSPGDTPVPPRPQDVAPPARGFVLAARIEKPTYTVLRFMAPAPARLSSGTLAAHGLGGVPAVVLVQG